MGIIIFIIFCVVIISISKSNTVNNLTEKKIRMYFTNVEKIFNSVDLILYKGDRSGENFLVAVKPNYLAFSILDLSKIYDTSEKYHIHNKILLSDGKLGSNQSVAKKLKEYEIRVLNHTEFEKIISNSDSFSILKTSDTSDDNCRIDKADSPIKYVENSGIFSIFRKKIDRL